MLHNALCLISYGNKQEAEGSELYLLSQPASGTQQIWLLGVVPNRGSIHRRTLEHDPRCSKR
jgi:hypothetical protein